MNASCFEWKKFVVKRKINRGERVNWIVGYVMHIVFSLCAIGESDGTESPVKRWTGLHYTEPGDDGMDPIIGESARSNSEIWAEQMVTGFNSQGAFSLGGMKSTRDLPPQSNHYDDEDSSHRNSNINAHPSPKASTVQVST